jgi:hypothetical protein
MITTLPKFKKLKEKFKKLLSYSLASLTRFSSPCHWSSKSGICSMGNRPLGNESSQEQRDEMPFHLDRIMGWVLLEGNWCSQATVNQQPPAHHEG